MYQQQGCRIYFKSFMSIRYLILMAVLIHLTSQSNCECVDCRGNTCYECRINFILVNDSCLDCPNCPIQQAQEVKKYKIIAGVFIFTSLFVIFVLCIYYKCCKINYAEHTHQNIDRSRIKLSQGDKASYLKNLNLKKRQIFLQNDEICSIYLDNKINLITDCRHHYHVKCIRLWMTYRQFSCPICKHNGINAKFTIFCKSCKQYQSYFSKQMIQVFLQEQSWAFCTYCQKIEQNIGAISNQIIISKQ